MEFPNRKPMRLTGFDYSSPNYYFITICTQNRARILSRITVGDGSPVPQFTQAGKICEKYIEQITNRFPTIHINKYVVMPNHIHLIVVVEPSGGTGDPSPTISDAIAWFKYLCTKQINNANGTAGIRVFQRSFHDHIIRDKADYQQIWQYIDTNPLKWESDCFYTPE